LLRNSEHRHVSQLPGANARDNFRLVVVLRESIELLRPLFHAGDTVSVGDAFTWNG
jgi:hypothetical protein